MGVAVIGTFECNQARSARHLLGQLERPFIRLRARIREVRHLQRVRQLCRQQRGEVHLRSLDELAVYHHVHVALGLLPYRPYDVGMAVTER